MYAVAAIIDVGLQVAGWAVSSPSAPTLAALPHRMPAALASRRLRNGGQGAVRLVLVWALPQASWCGVRTGETRGSTG